MPESESCSCELTSAILHRLSAKVARMLKFWRTMMMTNTTVTTSMASASGAEMVMRMTMAPTISMPQVMTHSGTWCAASQISKRSFTTRDIMSPELCWSK